MKQTLHYLLSRSPYLYRVVLLALGSKNVDKIAFLSLVKDGDTVLDIGANRGNFTVLFSHMVGRNGSVHAFEPVPPTFLALSQRVSNEKQYRNVFLNNFALGDTPGSFEIHVPSGDFGQASLQKHSAGSWSRTGIDTFTCDVRLLDDYVVEKGMTKIDFVKLDVEGAELPALRGARRLLNQFHPTIYLEFCPDWADAFGYTLADLLSFLNTNGYGYFYRDDKSLLEVPLEKAKNPDVFQNIICSTTPLKGMTA